MRLHGVFVKLGSSARGDVAFAAQHALLKAVREGRVQVKTVALIGASDTQGYCVDGRRGGYVDFVDGYPPFGSWTTDNCHDGNAGLT